MLRDKMQAVMAEVNGEVAEREKLVEYIAIALLTRSNLFILGDTGQAKSYAINRFRSRITGARQFERLLSKQCDEEQLFGRLDLGSLIPGGLPEAVRMGSNTYQTIYNDLTEALREYEDAPTDDALCELTDMASRMQDFCKVLSAAQPKSAEHHHRREDSRL